MGRFKKHSKRGLDIDEKDRKELVKLLLNKIKRLKHV